jgi:Flp pilus assembly protein CpaB
MEFAQKLVSTKWGTLAIAAVAALAAGIVLLVYLNSYRDEVNQQSTPVTVLVARGNIPKGTSGTVIATNGLYTVMTIPEGQLLQGAISDPASLRGRVATEEVFDGAQLTATSFVAGTGSLAGTLTQRERIVSIPLDSAHGLIGGIEKGNRVDIYAGFNVLPLNADGTPQQGGQTRPILRLIMSDVPVVAIGTPRAGGGPSNITLKVDDVKAAKLAFAADNGKIWLALRPSAGAKSSRPDLVTVETLLLGVPTVTMLHTLGGRK